MITVKLLGACLIVAASGYFGVSLAVRYRREIASLHSVVQILDYMASDLEFHLTPLPELCRKAATHGEGNLQKVLNKAADEMDRQLSPNVQQCFAEASNGAGELPRHTLHAVGELGRILGVFDLSGQLRGIESVKLNCLRKLQELEENKQQKTHNYQTLALCAGAALAILFI